MDATRCLRDSTRAAKACQQACRYGPRDVIAIAAHDTSSTPDEALFSLLFPAGGRPTLADAAALGEAGGAFGISYAPPAEEGWFEALVTGLTFEVHGLHPAPSEPTRPIAHRYGLASGWWEPNLEAVTIRTGPHLAGAGAMLPVVRGAVDLAAGLAGAMGVAAVVWMPARSAMAIDYFTTAARAWLGGGAFPAPGLVALVDSPESGVASQGLAFFVGQEVEVARWPGSTPAEVGRCVVRAVHTLVEHGPVSAPTRIATPDGDPLWFVPVGAGARVRVSSSE